MTKMIACKSRVLLVAMTVLMLALGSIALCGCAASGQASENQESLVPVRFDVDAPGWNEASTPIIVHIVSDDGEIDFYHAFYAGDDMTLGLAQGTYELSWITPINADGSMYSVGDAVTVDLGADGADVTLQFSPIAASAVTQTQVDAVLSQIADAVSMGDETLAGEAGSQIAHAAATCAKAAPAVNAEAVETAAAAVETAAAAPTRAKAVSAAAAAPAAPQGGQAQAQAAQPAAQAQSAAAPAANTTASNHEHRWELLTEPQEVLVVPERQTKQQVGEWHQCSCGQRFESAGEMNAHASAYFQEHRSWGPHGSSSVVPRYETVTVPAKYETREVRVGHRCTICGYEERK